MKAKCNIPPLTELTWSYGPSYWKQAFDTDTQDAPPEIIFSNLTDPPSQQKTYDHPPHTRRHASLYPMRTYRVYR